MTDVGSSRCEQQDVQGKRMTQVMRALYLDDRCSSLLHCTDELLIQICVILDGLSDRFALDCTMVDIRVL